MMNKRFSKTEMRGLPGGPNEQFTYVTGVFLQDMYHVPKAQEGLEKYQYGGYPMSHKDSVAHQADKIVKYEQLRGGPGGVPLPSYSDPKYMKMLMDDIYPEVNKIMPNATAMEKGEAMDFIFNAGWDKYNKKIKRDPRAYALQEYYRKYDKSQLDKNNNWTGRRGAPYSFDAEYNRTVGKLPENERRILMNKGRDWYYKNINVKPDGSPNDNYLATWYGRIWNTNDFSEFNPNNPKFTPNRQKGGEGLEKYQTKGEFNYNFVAPYNREWVPNKDRRGGKYVNKGIDFDNWNIEEPSQIQRSSTSVQQPFILSPKEWEAYNKDKAIQEKPGMFENYFNFLKKGVNRVYSDPGIISRRTNLLFDNLITSEDETPVNIGLRRKLKGDKTIWDETDLTFEDLSDQEFGIVMNLTNDEKMDSTYKDFQASQIIGGDYIDQNSRISRTASEFKNMDWEALKKKSTGDDYFDLKENEGYLVNPEQKGYYKIGVRNKNTNFNPQKDYFYGVQDGKVIAGPIDKFRDETIITPMRFGHRYYTKDNPPDLEKMKASSGFSPHMGDIKQLLYSPTTGATGMTSQPQGIMDFYNKYGDVIPIYLDDGSYGYVSTSRGINKLDYSDYQDYMASSLNKDRPKKGVDKHGSGQVGDNFGYNIFIKQKGGEGYRINAPGYNDPYKVIPSGNITMTEQDGGALQKGPLLGIDNMGNQQMMFPGYNYQFPGDMVMEIPVAQKGKGNFSVRPFARVFPINEPEFRALTGDIGIDTNIKNKPTYFRTSVRPTFGYSPLDPFQTHNLDLKGEGRVGYRIGDFNTELGVQKNLMRSDDPQLQASLGFNNRKFGINASTNIPTKNNPNFFPRVDLRYSPNEKLTFTGDAEYDSITKSPRFNVGLNYRFMQEGKELQKGQKGKIIKSIFDQYPGLYNVASPKDYKPIKAKGKHLEHLETTGTDVEYFAPGDTWYPFQYTTDIKLSVPGSKNKHRILYNPNLQNIEEALKLDIISHTYNTPETKALKADLDSKLRERYGDEMVDGNGGVDGYIRGYLSNLEEYAPYKKELEFLPKDYFKPFMEGLMKKQQGGEFQKLVNKYTTKGWQSLTDQEKQTYKEMYQQYK